MDPDVESGVGTRMALLIIALTLFSMLVLYELINWRPSASQLSPGPSQVGVRQRG